MLQAFLEGVVSHVLFFRTLRKFRTKNQRFTMIYTPENYHDIGTSPISLGNTSSDGGFPIVMLVFGGGPSICHRKTPLQEATQTLVKRAIRVGHPRRREALIFWGWKCSCYFGWWNFNLAHLIEGLMVYPSIRRWRRDWTAIRSSA